MLTGVEAGRRRPGGAAKRPQFGITLSRAGGTPVLNGPSCDSRIEGEGVADGRRVLFGRAEVAFFWNISPEARHGDIASLVHRHEGESVIAVLMREGRFQDAAAVSGDDLPGAVRVGALFVPEVIVRGEHRLGAALFHARPEIIADVGVARKAVGWHPRPRKCRFVAERENVPRGARRSVL